MIVEGERERIVVDDEVLSIRTLIFVCDKCGKRMPWEHSFLCPRKGQEYLPYGGKEILVAECDLCRDCAGQTPKLERVLL